MKIETLRIRDYRKLKQVDIHLEDTVTLLVGANNSGKSSAMECVVSFTKERAFSISDVPIATFTKLNSMARNWESDDGQVASGAPPYSWSELLPSLDIWVAADDSEAAYLRPILPLLSTYKGKVAVRYRLAPRDEAIFKAAYLEARTKAKILFDRATEFNLDQPADFWPVNLTDFLQTDFMRWFEIQHFALDPNWQPRAPVPDPTITTNDSFAAGASQTANITGGLQPEGTEDDDEVAGPPGHSLKTQPLADDAVALGYDPLADLLVVDFVNAQRLNGGIENESLSQLVNTFYQSFLHDASRSSDEDLKAVAASLRAQSAFDDVLSAAFSAALNEVRSVGYPGHGNPELVIRTDVDVVNTLTHKSVLKYGASNTPDRHSELPENLNGLGYRNLVLIMFRLMGFRLARRREDPSSSSPVAPLHLVLLEEPEAHLHPQVQQVFIRHAHHALVTPAASNSSSPGAQLVVSTHSSHLTHELDYDAIRYFKRLPKKVDEVSVVSLKTLFGRDLATRRFVRRYLKLHHSNTLFADALILLEGNAERILVPHFIADKYKTLSSSYIEMVEVGGAHAHRLRGLVEALGIPTLVVTDLDAADPAAGSKQCAPITGMGHVTTNYSLRSWLGAPDALDELFRFRSPTAGHSGTPAPADALVFFAHQIPQVYEHGNLSAQVIGSTFEDALAFDNLDVYSKGNLPGFASQIKQSVADSVSSGSLGEMQSQLFTCLKKADKSAFAVQALLDVENVRPPLYLAQGLQWLDNLLKSYPNLKSLDESIS